VKTISWRSFGRSVFLLMRFNLAHIAQAGVVVEQVTAVLVDLYTRDASIVDLDVIQTQGDGVQGLADNGTHDAGMGDDQDMFAAVPF